MPAKPQSKRRLPIEILTRQEVRTLFDACGDGTWTAHRDRALLALLYRAGLRLNEALTVRPCDVDIGRGSVRVLHGKGGGRTDGRDRRVGCRASGAVGVGPGGEGCPGGRSAGL